MGAETFPGWVLDVLDDNVRRKLIESWRPVPGRGLVVIGADMAERTLDAEQALGYVKGLEDGAALTPGQAEDVALRGERPAVTGYGQGYQWGLASAACAVHDGEARR